MLETLVARGVKNTLKNEGEFFVHPLPDPADLFLSQSCTAELQRRCYFTNRSFWAKAPPNQQPHPVGD